MRNFRLKHKISLSEIAGQMDKSAQWLSRVELAQIRTGPINKRKILTAFKNILKVRGKSLVQMKSEFETAKSRFFEEENEWTKP